MKTNSNKFIWINDDYRVNINSIFSLQKSVIGNKGSLNEWIKNYNEFINDPENYIELEVDDGIFWSPISDTKVSEDLIEIYAEKFDQYAESKIGRKPELSYQYTIITNTGVKINISQNKFDEINKAIDKQMMEDS